MKHTKSSEESTRQFLFRLTWSTFAGIFFVIPSFIVLYVLNDILRAWTNFKLRNKYGPKTHVLEEGSDAVWLYKVHNGKRQILYLAINDDPMDLERHRQNYLDKVLSLPAYQKLKQIFTEDFGYNIQKYDVNFDIKNHVKILEGSEDRIITEEELLTQILPQLSEDMDDSKPQWQDWILPNFKYDKDDDKVRSARVFKIHHAYMDGGSNLLMIADTQYEGDEFPYVFDPSAPLKVALWKRALYKFNCFLLFGWVVLHGLWAPSSKVVRNRFRTPKLSGQTNYAWSKPIPMEYLKKIKDTSGETMPTILMAALGGAICKLNDKYPATPPPIEENDWPCKDEYDTDELTVGMVAGILPYPDYKLKNRHSIFHVKVDVGKKTCVERLHSTSHTMKKVMWDPHVYLNLLIPSLFGRTPIWFSDACMSVLGFPLVLSNIPVAQKRVKLWDNDVLDIGGWPPMLSICGIGLVTIRYGENLRVCVNSDKAAMSKEALDYLISQIAVEVQHLSEEITIPTQEITNIQEKQSFFNKSFEESFLRNNSNGVTSLKFRLNASISTIKDSLSKFREP